ncbi:MAG: hypothetical protein ACJAQ4_000322 [Cryomorphaceae bacterium]|jgi:hypothetical protein
MSLCLFFLIACSSLGFDEDPISNDFTSTFVPADLWIENSRELILRKNSPSDQSTLTLYVELPSDDLRIEVILDETNELSKVNVPLTSSLSKTLYFDYGRLAFSETKLDGENQVISAYADSRVYAHALPDGGTPSSNQIKSAELTDRTIHSIIALAQGCSRKEKNATHNVRITEKDISIQDMVALEKDFTAVMNVKQGENIDISLSCDEPHVYFTISPSIGSDMEHRFWKGPATFTGDLKITVFTAEDIIDGSFKLDVKKL